MNSLGVCGFMIGRQLRVRVSKVRLEWKDASTQTTTTQVTNRCDFLFFLALSHRTAAFIVINLTVGSSR